MSNINYKETIKLNIGNISISENTLIRCTDNDESYFDVSTTKRVFTGPILYLNKESDRTSLAVATENALYFVIESKLLYKYTKLGWVLETSNFEELFMNNIDNNIYPIFLTRNGKKIAPYTYLDCVLTESGQTLEEVINNYANNDSDTTSTDVVATIDGQTTFTIPYPFTPYDLVRNIMLIIYKNNILEPDTYVLSSDTTKVILNSGIPKGDHITFKFTYSKSDDDDQNATSINNIRIFWSRPKVPRIYDTVIDIYKRKIESYDGANWRDIGSAHSLIQKTNAVILTSNKNTIPIGIDGYDKDEDNLMVFNNTTFLSKTTDTFTGDYKVSDDSKNIIKTSDNWVASSTSPQLFIFLCFKNVPTVNGKVNGSDLIEGSVGETQLSQGVLSKLNKESVTIEVLNNAITSLIGNAPSNMNTLEAISKALNNDPIFYTNMQNKINSINNNIDNMKELMSNKITITVTTVDNKSVNGQVVKVKNLSSGDYTENILINDNNSITISVDKSTSYEVSVNSKLGYLTPSTVNVPSGHLGDSSNVNFMYHL